MSYLIKKTIIDTMLGPMLALADDNELFLLEFLSKKDLKNNINKFQQSGCKITDGLNRPLQVIKQELEDYFSGNLIKFTAPYRMFGTTFQQQAWQSLLNIPYGETRSYREQAISLQNPKAFRAIANANGANKLAIIVPCHRVIASSGDLGGYSAGVSIKKWLLEHEKL